MYECKTRISGDINAQQAILELDFTELAIIAIIAFVASLAQ